MAQITLPFTFSSGAVIIASQHNSNFSTIYNDYNANIDNTNIVASAGIVYSKLNLTGTIVNSDINANAAIAGSKIASLDGSKLTGLSNIPISSGLIPLINLASGTAGTSMVILASGTNATIGPMVSVISNALFQYQGQIDQQGLSIGEITGATLNPNNATGTYRFLQSNSSGSTYVQIWTTKFIKISGISTVTVYCRIWNRLGSGGAISNFKLDIGGINNSVTGTTNTNSPEWKSFTINVSSLTNGTAYDVTASLYDSGLAAICYCSNIVGFGS